MAPIVLGHLLLLVSCAQQVKNESNQSTRDCEMSSWSLPVPITSDPGQVHLTATFPSLSIGDSEQFFIGNAIPFFDDRPVPPASLVALEIGGATIGKPAGNFSFAYPKTTVDSRRRLWMLWAEPRELSGSLPAIDWAMRELHDVWSSVYEPGSGWSVAARIHRSKRLIWNSASPRPRVSPDGQLTLVVLGATSEPLVLFRLENDSWQSFAVPFAAGPAAGAAYAGAIATGADVILGYIAANTAARGRDINSVFATRSSDGGVTWRKQTLVYSAALKPAYELRMFRDSQSRLHMIWMQVEPEGMALLRHVMSLDAGTTWEAPDDLPLPDNSMMNLEVEMDGCDTIHVLFQRSTDGISTFLNHAKWQLTWRPHERLFPLLRTNGVSAAVAKNGQLSIAFLGQPVSTPLGVPYTPMFSSIHAGATQFQQER